LEGLDLITDLVRQAGDRISIMPGGGIHERNVETIMRTSRAREVHLSARSAVESRMTYRNGRVTMGGALRPPEYSQQTTDAARVQTVVEQLSSL
jgi:copper homeostasis protein